MAERHGHGQDGVQDDSKNGSCSDASIATMTWEHSDFLSMPLADHTFGLVINRGTLDCVMCSLYQIESRMNIYRDDVERVLGLGDLEDEDDDSYKN